MKPERVPATRALRKGRSKERTARKGIKGSMGRSGNVVIFKNSAASPKKNEKTIIAYSLQVSDAIDRLKLQLYANLII